MKERGITLLELLIALTLVGLIVTGILFAMRIGLNAMERTNARVTEKRRVLGVDRIMHRQITALMPVKVNCAIEPGVSVLVPMFQGEADTMRFVSTYTLNDAARSRPTLLEYHVIPGERGEGVRLIVNELPYEVTRIAPGVCIGTEQSPDGPVGRFRPVDIGEGSFVLADRLARCRFLYKDVAPPPVTEKWVERWNAAHLPLAVRIEVEPLEPESTPVPLMPVTVSLRVDRDPAVFYANKQQ